MEIYTEYTVVEAANPQLPLSTVCMLIIFKYLSEQTLVLN